MISFIIPTLNEEKALGTLLHDLARYHEPHEVIVSDGNSTDRTRAIAREHGAALVEYHDTKRQTIGQARNMGAAAARGDFMVFLDADMSIPDPDSFFAGALGLFRARPRLVGLTVRLRVFPDQEQFGDRITGRFVDTINAIENNLLGFGAAGGEFQMVRSAAFHQTRGYNEQLAAGEDYEFFQRLSRIGQTRFESSLTLYHTGRRAHAVGWFKLICIWTINSVWIFLFGHAKSKEWTVIR
jgi:glycosyltransferase involved in cell wall biosynthesis